MADVQSEHNTLTADTVDTVSLTMDLNETLMVTNRSGANPIYFTIDGSTPTVAGDDTFVVPGTAGAAKHLRVKESADIDVKLISAGAEDYSVECY